MADELIPMHTEDVALFCMPPVNIGEDKIMWVDKPPQYVNKTGSNVIHFHIPGIGNQYVDLSKTELYVKLKITDPKYEMFTQGSEITITHEDETHVLKKYCIPVDNVLHSLWKSVDVKLNSSLVSSTGTDYMYKALLENLISYSKTAKETQLESIGFTGESGYFPATNPESTPFNQGLTKRFKLFKGYPGLSGIDATPDPSCCVE